MKFIRFVSHNDLDTEKLISCCIGKFMDNVFATPILGCIIRDSPSVTDSFLAISEPNSLKNRTNAGIER